MTLQDSDMKTISVTVSGLCENFVYNYVYLSADTYEEQMKTEPEYKNAFVCVSEGHRCTSAWNIPDGNVGCGSGQYFTG